MTEPRVSNMPADLNLNLPPPLSVPRLNLSLELTPSGENPAQNSTAMEQDPSQETDQEQRRWRRYIRPANAPFRQIELMENENVRRHILRAFHRQTLAQLEGTAGSPEISSADDESVRRLLILRAVERHRTVQQNESARRSEGSSMGEEQSVRSLRVFRADEIQGMAAQGELASNPERSSETPERTVECRVTAEEGNPSGKDFECNICLDMASDPVVTVCGHLYCWPCLYQWLHLHSHSRECPVCKGEVTDQHITPIYGRGNTGCPDQGKSKIPKRPHARRIESCRNDRPRFHGRIFSSWMGEAMALERIINGENENIGLWLEEDGNGGFRRRAVADRIRNRLRAQQLSQRDPFDEGRRSFEDIDRSFEDERRVRQRVIGRRGAFRTTSLETRTPTPSQEEVEEGTPFVLGTSVGRDGEAIWRQFVEHIRADREPPLETRRRTSPPLTVDGFEERMLPGVQASITRDQDEISRHLAFLRRQLRADRWPPLESRNRRPSHLVVDEVEERMPFGLDGSVSREQDERSRRLAFLGRNRADRTPPLESRTRTSSHLRVDEVGERVPFGLETSVAREGEEMLRHLAFLRRSRANRSFVEPRTSLSPHLVAEDVEERMAHHLVAEEVEERIARRLETSLAREQEEILRNLASIRHIRADRLASIRERLATMEGMLGTLANTNNHTVQTGNLAPVETNTSNVPIPVSQDLLPEQGGQEMSGAVGVEQ